MYNLIYSQYKLPITLVYLTDAGKLERSEARVKAGHPIQIKIEC